ncbi:hypothetical protein [Polymorphobacter fuscus]|uniref:Lipoprotein n=1 Tax=Sandarakinorhabdus fusca TaxID=1439888 RepID=A0A7C9GR12_9SPHN|nr:hypothetical protein [Polymorphobacter fuscus]KAB7647530.1 hypothetical protein F9290_05930 [Polymorphobacter fuscus]MQT16791.1 hypothetical protein [Polymorphobacter fuscus]NJC09221.1 hypothetical protein [Polymorphobacter fuscus]
MKVVWQLLPALVLAGCAATPAPVVAPPPPAPPPPGLQRLIGQDAAAVTRLLGPASLDRTEGPARQLQFVRPVCVLDVYLYPATPGGVPHVRTAAARKPDGSRIDPGACLSLIVPGR